MNVRQWKYPFWLKTIYCLLPIILVIYWGIVAADFEMGPFTPIVTYSVFNTLILMWPGLFLLEALRLGIRLFRTPNAFTKVWTGLFLGYLLILTISFLVSFQDAYASPFLTTFMLPGNGILLLSLLFGYLVDMVVVGVSHFVRLIKTTLSEG